MMPGVESFDVQDDAHWTAKVKIPLGLGGLRLSVNFEKTEERDLEYARLHAKGNGVGAIMNMDTQFNLADEGRRHGDGLGGRRPHRGPGRDHGPARAAADRQPAGVPTCSPRSSSEVTRPERRGRDPRRRRRDGRRAAPPPSGDGDRSRAEGLRPAGRRRRGDRPTPARAAPRRGSARCRGGVLRGPRGAHDVHRRAARIGLTSARAAVHTGLPDLIKPARSVARRLRCLRRSASASCSSRWSRSRRCSRRPASWTRRGWTRSGSPRPTRGGASTGWRRARPRSCRR